MVQFFFVQFSFWFFCPPLVAVVMDLAVVVVGEWDLEERRVEDSVKNNIVLMEYGKSILFIQSNG